MGIKVESFAFPLGVDSDLVIFRSSRVDIGDYKEG